MKGFIIFLLTLLFGMRRYLVIHNPDIKTPISKNMIVGMKQVFTHFTKDIPDEVPPFGITSVCMLVRLVFCAILFWSLKLLVVYPVQVIEIVTNLM